MKPSDQPRRPPPEADPPPAGGPDLVRLREQAEAALTARRDLRRDVTRRIEEDLDQLSEQLAEELERRRGDAEQQGRAELDDERQRIADTRREIDTARQDLLDQREEWQNVCTEVEAELAAREERVVAREQEAEQAVAANAEERQELDRWAGELADERLALEADRRGAGQDCASPDGCGVEPGARESAEREAKAVAERDALAEQLQAAERASAASAAALEADNQALSEKLHRAHAELAAAAGDAEAAEQLSDLRTRHDEAARVWREERAALTDSLAAAEDQLRRAVEQGESSNAELQGKFDLALADVERLRSRVDELEQELAERPAPGAAEAAELAELRRERDELAEQLGAARAASAETAGGDQETEDLRRRFELAVEDVRRLKTENAGLEQRLAEAGAASIDDDTGGMDWESQKRRMLAELEDEAPTDDTTRRQERATIEGTIRITDEVVAGKDREIAELRQQLHASPEGTTNASPPADPMADDERLAEERRRLADLEEEWREKLRAAELELSVERAKIAREQAELAEWRIELESKQGAAAEPPADGGAKSQRRWLDKLGLGGGD